MHLDSINLIWWFNISLMSIFATLTATLNITTHFTNGKKWPENNHNLAKVQFKPMKHWRLFCLQKKNLSMLLLKQTVRWAKVHQSQTTLDMCQFVYQQIFQRWTHDRGACNFSCWKRHNGRRCHLQRRKSLLWIFKFVFLRKTNCFRIKDQVLWTAHSGYYMDPPSSRWKTTHLLKNGSANVT